MSARVLARVAALASVVVAGTVSVMVCASAQADPGLGVCDLPGVSTVCNLGEQAVTSAAGSGFKEIVDSMLDGFAKLLEWSLSWWVRLPSPDLTDMSALSTVREYTTGLQVLLMTGAVMITAARLALAKRGALAGEVQESFMAFARAVFASWMFAAVITMATRAGDEFSNWLITDAAHGDPSSALSHLVEFSALTSKTGLGMTGMFILGLIGFVGALLQLALLVIRQALLIVVVAVIPIAASAAGTGPGSQAYKRLIGWAVAFALFKPVGAIVYLVAFSAAGAGGSDVQQQLLGLILLALVALVLPALMRMVAPAVSTMGSGGGGVAAAAMLGSGVGMGAAMGAKAGTHAAGGSGQSSANSGGSSGSTNQTSNSGGRSLAPSSAGVGGGSGGVVTPSGNGGSTTARSGTAATGGGQASAAGGAGASSAAAAAAGPAAAAVVAAEAVRATTQRVGEASQQISGETTAGAENGSRALGEHEVRR
ncbi:hypothetical protein IU500_24640 [Nocardia terpenica]|uniref:hypothetical protein n=1 Tax=Nocardia terpenica TaxID=455432 RepID=UPI0018935C67|nr:hypothetical protein [Nocardia terpenica]MBF6064689.1 hypothetical protein [Nocardia terpenica]MBF6107205.1 hypothetical protein [Nocardia terpenica]MBF6114963.1 hypothetical protein [Nocardia terpenica]MBF6122068.1 hypothetical protein [Nocardia terpenica]